MKRAAPAVAVMAVLLAALPGPAAAAPTRANPHGRFLGVVPKTGPRSALRFAPRNAAGSVNDLIDHEGPVMRTNRTHTIFWAPSGYSFPLNYQSLIDGYLANVGAASGQQTNVYSTNIQYFDASGSIAYSSVFGGSRPVDTGTFPSRNTLACPLRPGYPACLTDSQLISKIDGVINGASLPRGLGELYFIFLPQGVDVCGDSAGSRCASDPGSTGFCGYHSAFNPGPTLYAVHPYAAISGCDTDEHPNNSAADPTISVVSHEHNEAITDPLGTGWWVDNAASSYDGYENGDLCAWNFGSATGGSPGTPGTQYNQTINGAHYYIQQEWSNATSSCVLGYSGPARVAPVARVSAVPNPAGPGQVVAFDGSASTATGGTITNWTWSFGDGTNGTGPTPGHAYAVPGIYTASLTVTDDGGGRSTATIPVTVTAPPVPPSTQPPSSPPATVASTPPPITLPPAARALLEAVSVSSRQRGRSVVGSLRLGQKASTVQIKVYSAGRQLRSRRVVTVAAVTRRAVSPGTLKFSLKLSRRASTALSARRRLSLWVTISVTPVSGRATNVTRSLTLRR